MKQNKLIIILIIGMMIIPLVISECPDIPKDCSNDDLIDVVKSQKVLEPIFAREVTLRVLQDFSLLNKNPDLRKKWFNSLGLGGDFENVKINDFNGRDININNGDGFKGLILDINDFKIGGPGKNIDPESGEQIYSATLTPNLQLILKEGAKIKLRGFRIDKDKDGVWHVESYIAPPAENPQNDIIAPPPGVILDCQNEGSGDPKCGDDKVNPFVVTEADNYQKYYESLMKTNMIDLTDSGDVKFDLSKIQQIIIKKSKNYYIASNSNIEIKDGSIILKSTKLELDFGESNDREFRGYIDTYKMNSNGNLEPESRIFGEIKIYPDERRVMSSGSDLVSYMNKDGKTYETEYFIKEDLEFLRKDQNLDPKGDAYIIESLTEDGRIEISFKIKELEVIDDEGNEWRFFDSGRTLLGTDKEIQEIPLDFTQILDNGHEIHYTNNNKKIIAEYCSVCRKFGDFFSENNYEDQFFKRNIGGSSSQQFEDLPEIFPKEPVIPESIEYWGPDPDIFTLPIYDNQGNKIGESYHSWSKLKNSLNNLWRRFTGRENIDTPIKIDSDMLEETQIMLEDAPSLP